MTASDARGSVSPGEILDQLRARNAQLEDQLAKAQGALADRRRLQDLSPDELAMESVGAVGEIIKAARLQAQELRNSAQTELDKAREEGQNALRQARARARRPAPPRPRGRTGCTRRARASPAEPRRRARATRRTGASR